jgi:putative nucleotide binding protein
MKKKDNHAIVLDYLPYGYPLEGKMRPVVQAIGEEHLSLLELAPVRGASFNLKEKVYIGPDKRDKIYYIVGRLGREKLTETAKIQLQEFVEKIVGEQEKKFVNFFNSAQAINTRLHQLELLPGFGKKHTNEILTAREDKLFASFGDIKKRVHNVPDPKRAVERRIMEEVLENPRQLIFVS